MSARALLDAARARLEGAPREALGELVIPARILGIARAPRIVRRGAAWHLGALLLADDAVYAVGEVVRARTEARRGYTAQSQRERAALAAAARRDGFDEGETVHIGWQRIDVDAVDGGTASGPLVLVEGEARIRWSASGGLAPLESYLAERVALLRDPPPGA